MNSEWWKLRNELQGLGKLWDDAFYPRSCKSYIGKTLFTEQ